jgi:trans-aconitate 2-methyltransferase
VGVDASSAMLAAVVRGPYAALVEADAAVWQPDRPVALIFSNAALQWVPDHDRLMPRLAGLLVPGGVLAVQMPRQTNAPSHRFLRDIAASMFPDRFRRRTDHPRGEAGRDLLADALAPRRGCRMGDRLHPAAGACAEGHPVRLFTQSTAMRPILERLTPDEAQTFLHAYEAALGAAYPLLPDGAALFPFRRLFFTLKV